MATRLRDSSDAHEHDYYNGHQSPSSRHDDWFSDEKTRFRDNSLSDQSHASRLDGSNAPAAPPAHMSVDAHEIENDQDDDEDGSDLRHQSNNPVSNLINIISPKKGAASPHMFSRSPSSTSSARPASPLPPAAPSTSSAASSSSSSSSSIAAASAAPTPSASDSSSQQLHPDDQVAGKNTSKKGFLSGLFKRKGHSRMHSTDFDH